MKRVLTIQDISCIGKCSITVALPIISAMGVETAILPTAVLSTHTMFPGYTCKDLQDQIEPITKHWAQQEISFDGIYTGYLANKEQIELVKAVFDQFHTPDNIVIVDPAMADHGKLYPAFSDEFPAHMASLCEKADIILPNITEAAMMSGMEYKNEYDKSYVLELVKRLTNLGAKKCIITGVALEKNATGVFGYDRETEEEFYYKNEFIDAVFHGTGDVFASSFVGGLMHKNDWKKAAELAADYTAKTIQTTRKEKESMSWYGVNFEKEIPYLIERMRG